jgi:ATP-dependent Lon protease
LAEVPENLRTAMKLHFVDTMDQVLQIALESPLPTLREEEAAQPIAPLTSGTEDSATAHQ